MLIIVHQSSLVHVIEQYATHLIIPELESYRHVGEGALISIESVIEGCALRNAETVDLMTSPKIVILQREDANDDANFVALRKDQQLDLITLSSITGSCCY